MRGRIAARLLVIFCAIASGCCVVGCSRKVIYRDAHVVVWERRTLFDAFLVHAGRERYIAAGGHIYSGIMGEKPFYIVAPKNRLLLFVTEGRRGTRVLHGLDEQHGTNLTFQGPVTSFGMHIGWPDDRKGFPPDIVKSETQSNIVLQSFGFNWSQTVTVDLIARKIQEARTIYYNDQGQGADSQVQTQK